MYFIVKKSIKSGLEYRRKFKSEMILPYLINCVQVLGCVQVLVSLSTR